MNELKESLFEALENMDDYARMADVTPIGAYDTLKNGLQYLLDHQCPNLSPVINWLKNGCDVKEAIKELEIYQSQYYDRK